MKRTILIWTLAALLPFAVTLSAQEMEDETVNVVYQCDFPDVKRVHLMLNTLNNAVKYFQKNMIDYQIDVVALGPCLQYFMKDFEGTGFVGKPYLTQGGPTDDGTRSRFKSLKLLGADNINYFACENTMTKKNVKASQLDDDVQTTPGGIIKVIDDQRAGFSYIKIQ